MNSLIKNCIFIEIISFNASEYRDKKQEKIILTKKRTIKAYCKNFILGK
jgi:hypothetical protein